MSLRRAAALIPALAALAACVVGPGVASANPLGDLVRVSELEAGGDGGAYDVQVEYNAGTSEYLVSWTADGIFSPFEDEVYVQRLSAAGAEIGPDRATPRSGPPATPSTSPSPARRSPPTT